MSIRQVFRVQCDGPGKEWLSFTEDYVPGTDIEPRHEVAAPTAERAFNFPGERSARRAALAAGWKYTGVSPWNPEGQHATARGGTLLCPACQDLPDPALTRIPRGRLGARFIVTGKYEPDGTKRGVPYSACDVGVDAYEDPAMRLRITNDVHEHFAINHTGVTDVESFWIWMPDGDRIEGTNEG